MVAASRAKASDRAALLKKLFPIIKKQYKVHIPKGDKPVLETMLYAICLEDSSVDEADLSFKRLLTEFPDLNEVRVSTVGEIERAFAGQTDSEWRAFRVISVLKFVFDKSYSFEFESLRKKTLDLATKQLAKIKDLSPFVRDYTLHEITGAHLIPIDPALSRLLIWLGLSVPGQTQEQVGEMMKGAVRKAEVEAFVFTLRCLAADQSLHAAFDATKYPPPEGGHDTDTATERLNRLFKVGLEKPVRQPTVKKVAPVEKVADKPTKQAAELVSKSALKKPAESKHTELRHSVEAKKPEPTKDSVAVKKPKIVKKPEPSKSSVTINKMDAVKKFDTSKKPETAKKPESAKKVVKKSH